MRVASVNLYQEEVGIFSIFMLGDDLFRQRQDDMKGLDQTAADSKTTGLVI
jgi:hypothetical protein